MANKGESQVPAGLMGKEKKAQFSWQIVSTDLMGPFLRSTAGNKYILVVTDYLTKYSVLTPLGEVKTPQIVKFLEEQIILIYGAPQYLICDNGRQFVSAELKKNAAEYGCTIWYTASYHPQANPTERVNRVVKAMIASYFKDDQIKWDRQLPKIGFAFRTAVHEVTQFTPAYLNFVREPAKSGTQHGVDLGSGDLNQSRLALAER
jgi:transposase